MSTHFYPYDLILANIRFPVSFSFPDTARYFREFCVSAESEKKGLFLSDEDWEYGSRFGFARNAYSEYSLFTGIVSEALLEYKRCIVHAAAVRHDGRAWLIAAPSGVGKTTQIRTLQELYPGEFSVICGDRPVLQLTDDDRVMVYPSPWNGKENWYGAEAAPLEGIVLLRRGEENSFEALKTSSAAVPLFSAIIQNGSSTEMIKQVASFETNLLERVPVWHLINRDVPDSTVLMYEELFE